MTEKAGGLIGWIDERFPLTRLWNEHLAKYYAPKNFNLWYFFGSLALLVLVMQIVTGIFLTMHYKPDAALAFASVEYIMRDVEWGWLIRYMHSTGASAFFIIIYLHMFRGLMYGSFKKPRELLWLIGMFIYLTLMAEAFMGYLLPWGQMSYWGAQVIINLFGAIPYIGPDLAVWIRGDYVVSDATLNRFFAFHVIALPLVLVGLVFLHIMALHEVGSNNPDGIEIKADRDADGNPRDGVPFHPYYTVKDIVGAVVFLLLFTVVVFYVPEMGGYFLEHNNFVEANPLLTPEHISPLWYFTPFYTVLRAIPDPWYGVLAMTASILILFFLPWIDRNPVKSVRYRSFLYKVNLAFFVIAFVYLGYLGTLSVNPLRTEMAVRFSELYFLFFFVLWVYSKRRTAAFYIGWFAALVGLITLYDYVRGYDEIWPLIVPGWLIPAVYLAIHLLLPMVERLGSDKAAPARVRM
ncbi:MAG: cytochrome b N-terminal domain-containing protein [Gammaproteobacteria bacterium]|nr:cytochrome b N-terminal domain-containing protein [Gammaproteobacteria bacterium]